MAHFPRYPPAFKQKCFFLQGYCSFYQSQAWLQECGVFSECGLIHQTPSNLRLLTVCTPSSKGAMRPSTAATFLPFSTPEKACSPPFLRLLQAVTRTHDCPLKSLHPPGAGCRRDRRGPEGFLGSLSLGWIQAECKMKGRYQGSWHEGPASSAHHICSSYHLDFLTQAVSSATCFMPQFLFWGWSHLLLAPFSAL